MIPGHGWVPIRCWPMKAASVSAPHVIVISSYLGLSSPFRITNNPERSIIYRSSRSRFRRSPFRRSARPYCREVPCAFRILSAELYPVPTKSRGRRMYASCANSANPSRHVASSRVSRESSLSFPRTPYRAMATGSLCDDAAGALSADVFCAPATRCGGFQSRMFAPRGIPMGFRPSYRGRECRRRRAEYGSDLRIRRRVCRRR